MVYLLLAACRFLYSPYTFTGGQNDARMNLCIALTATRCGAVVANHTRVMNLLKDAEVGFCFFDLYLSSNISSDFSFTSLYRVKYAARTAEMN